MSALEDNALAEIKREAANVETAAQVKQTIDAPASANDVQFLEAKVKKTFTDGVLKGTVVQHVVLPLEVVSEGDVAVGERWLVRYENNKEELLTPQELLDILVAEAPKSKAADDPWPTTLCWAASSDRLKTTTLTWAPSSVLSVVLKKLAGAKKKRVRHYTVEFWNPAGQATLVREFQKFELTPFLV